MVGPKDLPLLLRKLGQWMAKARGMANEFRSSFDEMARQSELDELRKEVQALRTGHEGPGAPQRLAQGGHVEHPGRGLVAVAVGCSAALVGLLPCRQRA